MTIKSSPFGAVQLSGEDAACFAEIVRTKKTNPQAKQVVQRGCITLKNVRNYTKIEAR